jgi:hypothetical protein
MDKEKILRPTRFQLKKKVPRVSITQVKEPEPEPEPETVETKKEEEKEE